MIGSLSLILIILLLRDLAVLLFPESYFLKIEATEVREGLQRTSIFYV